MRRCETGRTHPIIVYDLSGTPANNSSATAVLEATADAIWTLERHGAPRRPPAVETVVVTGRRISERIPTPNRLRRQRPEVGDL